MKSQLSGQSARLAAPALTHLNLLAAGALCALACTAASAGGFGHEGKSPDDYARIDLVSDQPGVAMLQDTNLVNAWGISFSGTSPFWVSANGTGKALLYSVTNDAMGNPSVTKVGLEVDIPGDGTPTGQVFNNQGGFNGDVFIFASEDGTISGWRNALMTTAEVLASPTNTVYKGLSFASTTNGPLLLAANFRQGTIDAYRTNGTLFAQYADPTAPAGYAPFNVQTLNGMVFVTFAKQDDQKHDDVGGPGNGLIDVFDPNAGMFHRFATGKEAGGKLRAINSPWGLALSPTNFGAHSDQLLVGNFGSGTIMAFEADGKFDGLLETTHEKPVVIDGLWGLAFGNGGRGGVPSSLYFSAGPGGESHGLFGSLALAPEPPKHKPGHDHDGDRDDDHDRDRH